MPDYASVEDYIEKARGVDRLVANETRLEIRLTLLPPCEVADDDFDAEFEDCVCELEIVGKTTNSIITLSTGSDDLEENYFEEIVAAKLVLLTWIAETCTQLQSLKLVGSMHQVQNTIREYCSGRNASEFEDSFLDWSDFMAILESFADAGHWQQNLKELEIAGCVAYDLSGGATNGLDDRLKTLPQNLKAFSMTCTTSSEANVNKMIKGFPSIEHLSITCPEKDMFDHYEEVTVELKELLNGIHATNPNIRSISVRGEDYGNIKVLDNQQEEIFQILLGLKKLKVIRWNSQALTESFAETFLQKVPATNIREFSLRGMKMTTKGFEHLHAYLLQDSCKLAGFDLDVGTLEDAQVQALFRALKQPFPEAHILDTKRTTLDYLMVLRKFDTFLSLEHNKAAPIWPLILNAANTRDRGKKDRGRWLIHSHSDWQRYKDRLNRSLVFSLLRHRIDIIGDSLPEASKKPAATTGPAAKKPKV